MSVVRIAAGAVAPHPGPGWAAGPGLPPAGLYLHVPFCRSICPYCDFVVVAGRAARGPGSRIGAVAAALATEVRLRADLLDRAHGTSRPPLTSVYLGGGTPSLLAPGQVADLLAVVVERLGLAPDAEVTLEANPGPDEHGDLAGYRAAGVTRLSIGAQSRHAAELRRLGRRHGPDDVAATVRDARAAGIRSVALDLLIGVPGQDARSWDATLDRVLALAPDHVSAYHLALDDPDAEGRTGPLGDHLPLRDGARRWRARARAAVDDDRTVELDALGEARLAAAGFERYEIANHARPGHAARHNLHYWERRSVLAAGPGAHAFDGVAVRSWNAAPLDPWLAALRPADGTAPALPPGDSVVLSPDDARAEAAILGLRLARGIGPELADDPALAPALAWGVHAGLLVRDPAGARLTARGRLLSNELFARLLP
ncbi:MAG: coproporphyrinogen-III oxidase family protein [Chloroflexota bacterium]